MNPLILKAGSAFRKMKDQYSDTVNGLSMIKKKTQIEIAAFREAPNCPDFSKRAWGFCYR
ncbi:MAG: hypothetical protein A2W95_01805 [Bacteroidetes bacterium GWA2_40_14]|jgi:hypothetical protein|nr:MAG: hypothetical protein A2W95_01805 [Bacteroidetes bacterium GWA2_40_14]HAZ01974.1 hypothetical protein [Marinilabiliales bacterium]